MRDFAAVSIEEVEAGEGAVNEFVVLGGGVDEVDGFIAGWLPGTEGDGIADVLFGDHDFTGTLRYTWPRSMGQIPLGNDESEPAQFLPGDRA